MVIPVTPEVGLVLVVILAVVGKTDQVIVPTVCAVPFNVYLSEQIVSAVPGFGALGSASTVTVFTSLVTVLLAGAGARQVELVVIVTVKVSVAFVKAGVVTVFND